MGKMNILVTGANGFFGKNLCETLKNIRDGKDRTHPGCLIDRIFEIDLQSSESEFISACKSADFVFHLAGINRPQNSEEFTTGNVGALESLLSNLNTFHNNAPVMLSSSIQASLIGRYENSAYGISKKNAEELLISDSEKSERKIYIYRFPNLFGKWCRPNYNSVVATFCNNIANDLPIQVNDKNTELELLYIDDLVSEMINVLDGNVHRCEFNGTAALPQTDGRFCYVPLTYHVTLGRIVELLNVFRQQSTTLKMPCIPESSFEKKLYSTYLSYLPKEKTIYPLKMNVDDRGSFTELLKTSDCGQFSLNVSKPGITKGMHWHHSKWEIFIVVSGHARIQERKIGSDEIREFNVSGEKLEAVYMLPGYTHNIINCSETEDLITLMWANENFDKDYPDTFYETVYYDK